MTTTFKPEQSTRLLRSEKRPIITEAPRELPDFSKEGSGSHGGDSNEAQNNAVGPSSKAARIAMNQMGFAVGRFKDSVDKAPEQDSPSASRNMSMMFEELDPKEYDLGDWAPARTLRYSYSNPFAEINPELARSSRVLYSDVTAILRGVEAMVGHGDGTLTYIKNGRGSRGGKRFTEITQSLANADLEINAWLRTLPNAECLRVVAHPWPETKTLKLGEDGEIVERPSSKLLRALVGGEIGRDVIAREVWERAIMSKHLKQSVVADGRLSITSIGTGTGEPIIDTGIQFLNDIKAGSPLELEINGFDVNPSALAVADRIAKEKTTEKVTINFTGNVGNILDPEVLKKAIIDSRPEVVEMIGFAEYVPSVNPATQGESTQRDLMERMGNVSAEDFFRIIYENIPEGALILTGNMRDDGSQNSVVFDGFGWGGVIARDTETFLCILKNAGIPQEAVELYVPPEGGHFNMVAIRKPNI